MHDKKIAIRNDVYVSFQKFNLLMGRIKDLKLEGSPVVARGSRQSPGGGQGGKAPGGIWIIQICRIKMKSSELEFSDISSCDYN